MYEYDTFMIPFVTESLKCVLSVVFELFTTTVESKRTQFGVCRFLQFSLPAACYFATNNCMFYIIKELGGATFQVTNSLKILSTGLLMRMCLGRKLRWCQWKALIILTIGCAVTQLKMCTEDNLGDQSRSKRSVGYAMVLLNAFASGAGGVVSEKLLKGSQGTMETIHRQNAQLYFFGAVFGLIAIQRNKYSKTSVDDNMDVSHEAMSMFSGFNAFAFATIFSLTASGLLVSFVLKYMDNVVKCFVVAGGMMLVALFNICIGDEHQPLQLFFGMTLNCLALEQYYFS